MLFASRNYTIGDAPSRRPRRVRCFPLLDVTPGVDAVFEELGARYGGPVTVSQDVTVFNVTEEAVVARQATVNDAAPPVGERAVGTPVLEVRPPRAPAPA